MQAVEEAVPGGLAAAVAAEPEGAGPEVKQPTPQEELSRAGAPALGAPSDEELDGFLSFCDVISVQVTRGVAVVYKVPWTDELRKASQLTATERKQLRMVAAPAYPYIAKVLANSSIIGLGLFIVSYGEMLWERGKLVTGKAPRPKKVGRPKKSEKPQGVTDDGAGGAMS